MPVAALLLRRQNKNKFVWRNRCKFAKSSSNAIPLMYSPGEIQLRVLYPNDRTRASLIERVRDWGDDASWREFSAIYRRLIFSFAIKAGLTGEESEEVAQATMISVACAIRNFEYRRELGSFKAWLYSQAKWKINDQLRGRMRDGEMFFRRREPTTATGTGTVARFPDRRNEHEAFLQRDWNEAVTETACDRVKTMVKPKHFQIFDLYVVKGWPLRRVCRTLSVSVPQVYLISSRVFILMKKQTRQVQAQLERPPCPSFPDPQNKQTETL
jgi:RNA polymerase sigma factor (sigma-70 family)